MHKRRHLKKFPLLCGAQQDLPEKGQVSHKFLGTAGRSPREGIQAALPDRGRNAMKTRLCVLVLVFLVGLPPVGWTQDSPPKDLTELSLEQLMEIPVYGASRYEQQEKNVPAAVTIVTKREIKKFGYRTLAEILQSVPGFYLNYDRNYHYLGVRGFSLAGDYNTRVLILVDGHRVRDGVYTQAPLGTDFPVEVDLIERVEVIRGPGSVMYGGNALFAVINVITRSGRDVKGLEVSPEVGLYTYKGRVSYGNRLTNGLEILQSGSFYDSRGDRRYPVTGLGVAFDGDYDRYVNSFTKLSYRDFTFTGAFHARKKGFPTGAWETVFNDKDNQTRDTWAFADLKYERKVARDWNLLAHLYYDYYGYTGTYLLNYAEAGDPLLLVKNKDSATSMRWGGEAQVTKKFLQRHMVVFGGEFYQNFIMHQKNYDESPFFKYIDDRRDSWVFGVYVQDEISLFKNLSLFAGVRYDYYSGMEGSINPRFALIYHPFQSTTLKVLYGQAFRPPNAYELYYKDGITQRANPSLRPEKIRTFELVWEQQLAKNWQLKTSGFFNQISDLILQGADSDGFLHFINAGKVKAKGLEVELSGKWQKYLEGRLSYSLQEAKDSQTRLLLPNLPKQMVKANLIFPLYQDKIFAGVETLYASGRIALSGKKVSGYSTTNLTLFSKNIVPRLEFSASVYNLFNQRYYFPGGEEHLSSGVDRLRQDGINFRVKLQYTF
jgi:iron complex outermembrane receptor protein